MHFRRSTFIAVDAGVSGKVSLAIHESTQEGSEWSEPAPVPALAGAGVTTVQREFLPEVRASGLETP